MAKVNALIQGFINSVKETVFYHKERLNELKFKDYPFEASKDFIDVIIRIQEDLLEVLDSFEAKLLEHVEKNETIPEDMLIRIKRYGQLVGGLHSTLQILELGRREYISHGSVVLIESITKSLGSESQFVLLPLYQYNFTYFELLESIKTMLKDVLPNIEEILFGFGFAEKFAVIGFPLVHKQNILLSSLLAHEVGHFINEQKHMGEDLMEKVEIDVEGVNEIVKDCYRMLSGGKDVKLTHFIEPAAMKAEIHKTATKWISNWLKELISDTLAFHLFGPAYLFALTNFLLTLSDIDEVSSDYPSPRMRIGLLLNEFDEMEYPSTLKNLKTKNNTEKKIAMEFVEVFEAIGELLSRVEEEKKDKIAALVHNSIENVISELRTVVHGVVGANEYNPKKFVEEVFPLILHLNSFVPPAERSAEEPASPISILNVGMLYKLLLKDNLYQMLNADTPEKKRYAIHKLHELTLKALELRDIQFLMKKG